MGLNRSTIAGLVTELESLGLADQAKPSGTRIGAGRPGQSRCELPITKPPPATSMPATAFLGLRRPTTSRIT